MSEVGTSKMISLSMAGEDFQKIALPNLKSNEPPPSKLGGIRRVVSFILALKGED